MAGSYACCLPLDARCQVASASQTAHNSASSSSVDLSKVAEDDIRSFLNLALGDSWHHFTHLWLK